MIVPCSLLHVCFFFSSKTYLCTLFCFHQAKSYEVPLVNCLSKQNVKNTNYCITHTWIDHLFPRTRDSSLTISVNHSPLRHHTNQQLKIFITINAHPKNIQYFLQHLELPSISFPNLTHLSLPNIYFTYLY